MLTEEQVRELKKIPEVQDQLKKDQGDLRNIANDLSNPNSDLYKALCTFVKSQGVFLKNVQENLHRALQSAMKVIEQSTKKSHSINSAGNNDIDFTSSLQNNNALEMAQFIRRLQEFVNNFSDKTSEIIKEQTAVQEEAKELVFRMETLDLAKQLSEFTKKNNPTDAKDELSLLGKIADEGKEEGVVTKTIKPSLLRAANKIKNKTEEEEEAIVQKKEQFKEKQQKSNERTEELFSQVFKLLDGVQHLVNKEFINDTYKQYQEGKIEGNDAIAKVGKYLLWISQAADLKAASQRFDGQQNTAVEQDDTYSSGMSAGSK